MTKIEYYKVPMLHTRRLHKQLCEKYKVLVTGKGKKRFYHGEDILVAIDKNVATVIYGTTISEDVIKKLFQF